MLERVVLIVLDSVGVGALPDADRYGDEGSNTLKHIAEAVGGLSLPNLQEFGLGNIIHLPGVPPVDFPVAAYGKMAERSAGKDTTTGHWEIAGLVLDKPFPTYPQGFPSDLISRFESAIGRKVLGNKVASGTEIIKELGEEHLRTGYPIVYTSADSVFQVAAHEDIIPVEELYRICKIARDMLVGEHAVGRVIARPFIGEPGNFQRTPRRHDFSLEPVGKTLLDNLYEKGFEVLAVGKVSDIFAGRGITRSYPTKNNSDGIDKIVEALQQPFKGLIFANLVDFDMVYGHRNDPEGYAGALEEFDHRLPEICSCLNARDMLVITADHGCDPTTESTDHSREYVPLFFWGDRIRKGVDLGTRDTFADIAATLADVFRVERPANGTSMADIILLSEEEENG
ncbi:phosphopentomutase [Calderihabitans maritimus]|uniref:Phosphopentomutase n=1 Tax=Calderihabitans maritimus TaxID=1246530 RepID=A0A1Z5HQ94_9FIRM|nr:phosphopentomutase [Calderihabitans maritimus]GAW91684.1 phosphopentomutase [Calderihabitans maritimus]